MEKHTPETDPVFDPNAHKIIPFSHIIRKDKSALDQLSKEFSARGWCIVMLPKEGEISIQPEIGTTFSTLGHIPYDYLLHPSNMDLIYQASKRNNPRTDANVVFTSFFTLPQSSKSKFKHFSDVGHKETLHFVFPFANRFSMPMQDDELEGYPSGVKRVLHSWEAILQIITDDLIENLSEIFECSPATLATRANLPVANGGHKLMLDIVDYKNVKKQNEIPGVSPPVGHSTEDVNCVPHYDPGLLSLSFLSTHDGLQLQDPATGRWFAGPVNTRKGQENLGVIWLGEAAVNASKGRFKAGVHRVVYPSVPHPRTTAWFEICTVDQLLVNNKLDQYQAGQIIKPDNILDASNFTSQAPPTFQIERFYGIPASKTRATRADKFKSYLSEDNKKSNSNSN